MGWGWAGGVKLKGQKSYLAHVHLSRKKAVRWMARGILGGSAYDPKGRHRNHPPLQERCTLLGALCLHTLLRLGRTLWANRAACWEVRPAHCLANE